MTEANPPVGALDIGSNTVRMLVARPADGTLEYLLDRGAYARLGQGVDTTGVLAEETQRAALHSIAEFVQQARAAGAETIAAVATSAIRDAGNGPQFVERIQEVAGLEPEIISGDREAELTFLGATLGESLDVETVVVDLGGGSGEVIVAQGKKPSWARALPIGSRRLTERFIHSNPPAREQLDAVAEHVRALLETLPTASPQNGIFAGGTAKALPAVLSKPEPPVQLSRRDLEIVLAVVEGTPVDSLTQESGLPAERSQVLAAGTATLAEIARFYGLSGVTIAATGIREGMIIDMLQAQGRWS